MKHTKYNGVVLVLEGADGDGKNVILALALAPKENRANYNWFLGQCLQAGLGAWINQPGHAIISDRHKVSRHTRQSLRHVPRALVLQSKNASRTSPV